MGEKQQRKTSKELAELPCAETVAFAGGPPVPAVRSVTEAAGEEACPSPSPPAPPEYEKIESELPPRSALLSLDPSGKLRSGTDLKLLDEEPSMLREHGKGRYQMVRALAEGGMGRVYLVKDCDLNRQVALKVMLSEGADLRERFIEEAQVLGQLEHPNIVPLHELGVTGKGRPYCTMRYVKGRSLNELLGLLRAGNEEAVRGYSLTRLVQIFLQIVQALDYAHSRGVIHRDLKPSNVMLGEHGEVQVLDWGLAKVVAANGGVATLQRSEMTIPGQVLGTPSYMSPEQALGQDADQRSDIYSLGVLLYEILTLRRPFGGSSQSELLASVVRDPPPAPRIVTPGRNIPADLERACIRALAKNPRDRHQTARELHDEVQRWFEAETDKSRRRELADERALAGRAKLDEYFRTKAEVHASCSLHV